jgi:hypothetical protein
MSTASKNVDMRNIPMDGKPEGLSRFGAVCGVIFGLSLGVPGIIEAFTGETAVTSFIVGLGAAFGVPALFAFHLRQADVAGRFGAVAFAVNVIGLGLFAGGTFAFNLVLFFVDESVFEAVLDGPTRWAILAGLILTYLGMSGAEAVTLLRQKRQGALYNRHFAAYLQALPAAGAPEWGAGDEGFFLGHRPA